MTIKEDIERLKERVLEAQRTLSRLTDELVYMQSDIQNNVYESLDEAEDVLMSQFENEAYEDCEGSGNCGAEEYTQDFIVDGKEYTAIGNFSYDRHDKQYYYIDECSYSCVEKS